MITLRRLQGQTGRVIARLQEFSAARCLLVAQRASLVAELRELTAAIEQAPDHAHDDLIDTAGCTRCAG